MNFVDNGLAFVKKNYSYLLLAMGIIFFFPIVFSSIELMGSIDTKLPLWFIVVSFAISLLSLCMVIFFEIRKINQKYNFVFLAVILLLVVYTVIIISIQPEEILITARAYWNADDKIGHMVDILTNISNLDKAVFIMQTTLTITIVYIGLFLLPNKINNLNFIYFLGIVICLLVFATVIYSLVFEFEKYILVFKDVFGIDQIEGKILDYCPKSIYGHKNIYGLALMLALGQLIIFNSVKKTKLFPYVYIFIGIIVFFTQCRAALLIYVLVTFVYVYYWLIKGVKNNKKNYKTLLLVVSGIVATFAIIFVILLLSIESLRTRIIGLFDSGETFVGRINIWKNSLYSLQPNWYITGRGYGVFNKVLLNVNGELRRDFTYSSHGWFMAMLGRGGVVYLASFLFVVVLSVYIFIKVYHNEKNISFSMFLSIISIFLFSCVEDFYYVFLFLVMELLVLNNVLLKNNQVGYNDEINYL